jgi:hypothetical protein
MKRIGNAADAQVTSADRDPDLILPARKPLHDALASLSCPRPGRYVRVTR